MEGRGGQGGRLSSLFAFTFYRERFVLEAFYIGWAWKRYLTETDDFPEVRFSGKRISSSRPYHRLARVVSLHKANTGAFRRYARLLLRLGSRTDIIGTS